MLVLASLTTSKSAWPARISRRPEPALSQSLSDRLVITGEPREMTQGVCSDLFNMDGVRWRSGRASGKLAPIHGHGQIILGGIREIRNHGQVGYDQPSIFGPPRRGMDGDRGAAHLSNRILRYVMRVNG